MKRLVSIILPFRNEETYVEECLQSILRQSYGNWELLAVDDHSTDRSACILRAYSESDSRISYIPNIKKGIIPALQSGYQASKGEIITRMDADDIMPPDKLLDLSANLREDQVRTGLIKYFSSDVISPGYKRYEKWLNNNLLSENPWKQIYRECILASANWMITRRTFDRLQAFDSLEYPEDYDLTLRWYAAKLKIQVFTGVTHHWRDHALRTSKTSTNYQQKSFFRLKIQRFAQYEKTDKGVVLWGRGQKSKLVQKYLQEANVKVVCLDITQYQDTVKYHGLPVLLAIYPKEEERLKIQSFLNSIDYFEGFNFWYL